MPNELEERLILVKQCRRDREQREKAQSPRPNRRLQQSKEGIGVRIHKSDDE